ncbi:NACHT domain-containing protein [Geovibrio ferrireducens]|uniref:NACHT domain-containing protein n=1 Tax=Geovibrio ferrireducens TaxID=46201 RepID=UPI002247356F|nr:hypothetical protein [Geovibrio ferrireducens]
MTFINLELLKNNQEDDKSELVYIDQIVNNKLSVILGSPGSGKTSILKKFQEEKQKTAQYTTVREFLINNIEIKQETTVLLLDGLDEYRSIKPDKSFVTRELGNKLRNLSSNIVIACREMDWYGDNDIEALEDYLDSDVNIYYVQLLSDDKKRELAQCYGIANTDDFIKKYKDYGFLENPQMFKMLYELSQNSPEQIEKKMQLFEKYISSAKEKNHTRIYSDLKKLSEQEILEYVGYIASYYILSRVTKFTDDVINMISTDKYSEENLKKALDTTLFNDNCFTHRTIAEFAFAYFLSKVFLSSESENNLRKIRSLFIVKNKIPSELRATYAWLCSISQKEELTNADPYNQIIYGDNSLFDIELKKEIIKQVKKYSQETEPWFLNSLHEPELIGFYDTKLDDFLINEFQESLNIKTHYRFFISTIISTATGPSAKLIDFIKNYIDENNEDYSAKTDFIQLLKADVSFLKQVLDKIKNAEIPDSRDLIKNKILRYLYLKEITPHEVVDYVTLYHTDSSFDCLFLFSTPYEEKLKLIKNLLIKFKELHNEKVRRRLYFLEKFINDYLHETIFREQNTADKIYSTFYELSSSYDFFHFDFEAFRINSEENETEKQNRLEKLSNELYAKHTDDDANMDMRYFMMSFFSKYPPTRRTEINMSKFNNTNSKEKNESLLHILIIGLPKNKSGKPKLTEEIKEVIKTHKLEETLNEMLKPKKWEIEQREHEKKRKEKSVKIKENNETYFSARSDDDILSDFDDLFFISRLFYITRQKSEINYLEQNTVQRLKQIMKQAIFQPVDNKLLSLESLINDAQLESRNVDDVYYVSCALNKPEDLIALHKTILDYVFIQSLRNENIHGIIPLKFHNYYEKEFKSKSENIIKNFLIRICKHLFKENYETVSNYLKNTKYSSLRKLASISVFQNKDLFNTFLFEFLKIYAFELSTNDLETLQRNSGINQENTNIIKALLLLNNNNKENFTLSSALAVFGLMDRDRKYFSFKITNKMKVRLIDFMFNSFNTEDLIKHRNGVQSIHDQCASFLREHIINDLPYNDLKYLLSQHNNDGDIWRYRILSRLNQIESTRANDSYNPYSIESTKNFILSEAIINKKDFFEEVYARLEKLRDKIQNNRNNEKDAFYNHLKKTKTKKDENMCRDEIMRNLSNLYNKDILITKEKYEANNRVDINIKYKANTDYEVQIECKNDSNSELYKGINEQLYKKYLNGCEFGIYIVFFFNKTKNQENMVNKIISNIPQEKSDSIKVLCIDLTF